METKYIKGVGEKRAKLLAKDLGINDVRELLYYCLLYTSGAADD